AEDGIRGFHVTGVQTCALPISLAWLYAANIGACAYPALSIGNASLLLAHGSPAQVEAFALPQLRGEWTGTMCLSEPQAGSSLSEIGRASGRESHELSVVLGACT